MWKDKDVKSRICTAKIPSEMEVVPRYSHLDCTHLDCQKLDCNILTTLDIWTAIV